MKTDNWKTKNIYQNIKHTKAYSRERNSLTALSCRPELVLRSRWCTRGLELFALPPSELAHWNRSECVWCHAGFSLLVGGKKAKAKEKAKRRRKKKNRFSLKNYETRSVEPTHCTQHISSHTTEARRGTSKQGRQAGRHIRAQQSKGMKKHHRHTFLQSYFCFFARSQSDSAVNCAKCEIYKPVEYGKAPTIVQLYLAFSPASDRRTTHTIFVFNATTMTK